jgi:hypothetical protein
MLFQPTFSEETKRRVSILLFDVKFWHHNTLLNSGGRRDVWRKERHLEERSGV